LGCILEVEKIMHRKALDCCVRHESKCDGQEDIVVMVSNSIVVFVVILGVPGKVGVKGRDA
jgi:hypothetical protein